MEAQVLQFFQWLWGSWWDPVWKVFEPVWPLAWALMKIIVLLVPLMLAVAYLPLASRSPMRSS